MWKDTDPLILMYSDKDVNEDMAWVGGKNENLESRKEMGDRRVIESIEKISPNNPSFYGRINELFSDYKLSEDESGEIVSKIEESFRDYKLRNYQAFVGAYMKKYGRGLLIYHQLGSGKTLTAINMIDILKRDTVIMLPAALRESWKREYIVPLLGKTDYDIQFISYNAPNIMEQYKNLEPNILLRGIGKKNNFDGKLVIIDESHEFFQHVISGKAKQAYELFIKLLNARDVKFLFLSGTPIVGNVFELVPCMILLRGYIGKGKGRGSGRENMLFPSKIEEFYKYFVNENGDDIINSDIFKERITGLVSFIGGFKDPMRKLLPKVEKLEIVRIPMGEVQQKIYIRVRQKEKDIERKFQFLTKKFKSGVFKKPTRESVGTYKINSGKVCNFAFPPDIHKLFNEMNKNFIKNMQKIPLDVWKKIEEEYNLVGPWPLAFKIAEIKWQIMINKYSFEKIHSILPMLSGKLAKLIEMIKKNKEMKKFVYSKMKILGTKIIGEMLRVEGYIEIKNVDDFNKNKQDHHRAFMIVDGDTKDKKKMIDLFNNPENIRGGICELLLGTQVVSKGVNFFGIREIFVFEPQWSSSTVNQVLGRAKRLYSHEALKFDERVVKTYLLISVSQREKSTDEILYEIMLNRDRLNNKFLHLLREAAIDCDLNLVINQPNTDEIIDCYDCKDHDPNRKLFPPSYINHITEGPVCDVEIRLYPIPGKEDQKNLKMDKNKKIYKLDPTSGRWEMVG
jgi:superfamily II DNA or RNA helicase